MVDVSNMGDAHRTVEEVEAGWRRWAQREGLTTRRRAGDLSTELRTSRKTVEAFVSAGKWIASCPECNGGIACWPVHERGCCLDCGTIFRVAWPEEAEITEAVELLRVRPEPQRNWHRHEGEGIEFLRRENAAYQFAAADRGVVRVAELREVLSKKAFAELEKAGLV